MNKSAKIIVTGGSGLIGSYLLRKLVDRGYENLHAIHKHNDPLDLVQDFRDRINWHVADITDSLVLNDLFDGVETVIHCAGMISFWPKEYKEMFRVNVDGTATIVNLCLEHKVSRLIHLSSIEALGREEDNSVISEKTEWKEDTDHTKYAISKYLGELEVWRGIAEGLDAIIYNPALVLGAGYWDSGPMKLITDVYNGLRFYPQGGIAVVDVRDLVTTISDNLSNTEMYSNRFIVGSHNVKFKNLLDQIATNLGVDKPSIVLSGWMASSAIWLEKIKSIFTNSKPLINKETHLVSSQELSYAFDKISRVYNLVARPLGETISDTAAIFKTSYAEGKKFGKLDS